MKFLLSALIAFAFCSNLFAKEITGYVVRVKDGDTIRIETNGREVEEIRLLGIDAPEKDQEYGPEAGMFLAQHILHEKVTIFYEKRDFFYRILGKVIYKNKDMNKLVLQNGYAWFYKKYRSSQPEQDRETYANLEQKAREHSIGLWKQEDPMAPWDWRKQK